MQPHKHQALIIQWANGAKIQYRKPDELVWKDSDPPAWVEDYEYRVKPAEPERVYPTTKMDAGELHVIYLENSKPTYYAGFTAIANAALRHAIDAGQVVTREEFDRAVGDRKARDMEVARAVVHAMHRSYRAGHITGIIGINVESIVNSLKP